MKSQVTKRQHYVWRAYLAAWTRNDQIYCLRKGKLFPSNLMNVAQERYFYQLQDLNPKELDLVRQITTSNSHSALKENDEQWLRLFTRVFDDKKKLQDKGLLNEEVQKKFKEAEIGLEEFLHSTVESESKKYLDMLLNQDTSFYEDEADAANFCLFFAMQYVRTPKILENMRQGIIGIDGIDVKKIWALSKIIFANRLAWSIFSQRSRYKMYLLLSNGGRFITGDQPIINTHAVGFEDIPTSVDWFYPISPNTAVLLSESKRERVSYLADSDVQKYNEMIFKSSYQQTYSIEQFDLEMFQDGE